MLAGILALEKPIKKQNTMYKPVLAITALVTLNVHYPEHNGQNGSFASNICLLSALKLTVCSKLVS